MDERYLYVGLIRLHILHHAAEEPIYGLGMIEELGRHGYKLSAGTLYPLLHGLERRGYLISSTLRQGSAERRMYRATRRGRAALAAAKVKVQELFGELFEDEHS
jgi:DNA-binding PadR family transcriptional regulator